MTTPSDATPNHPGWTSPVPPITAADAITSAEELEAMAGVERECRGSVPKLIASSLERAAGILRRLASSNDADPNAPWLTLAHSICTDLGIPHGHITNRLQALRERLSDKPIDHLSPAIISHAPAFPEGWVPLRIEYEPGYPEDVAFGPQIMMDRLKKWLDQYFAMLRAAPAQAQPAEPPAAPALSIDLCLRLQQMCSDWGAYWRASDAHGVDLTLTQATELLREALGVEVEIAGLSPDAYAVGRADEAAQQAQQEGA